MNSGLTLITCFLLLASFYCNSQHLSNTEELVDILKIETTEYDSGAETKISFKPTINPKKVDYDLRRRFEYILYNKSDYSTENLKQYYPDTLKIDRLYKDQIIDNSSVLNYVDTLYRAIIGQGYSKPIYTEETLFKVASKFFLVMGFNGPKNLDWRVCVGLNGIEDQYWEEDYTLLEAFSFEAIFENLQSSDPNNQEFMNHFIQYIAEAEKKNLSLSKEEAIDKSKVETFLNMENDQDLRKMLLKYYQTNIDNLPFTIVKP